LTEKLSRRKRLSKRLQERRSEPFQRCQEVKKNHGERLRVGARHDDSHAYELTEGLLEGFLQACRPQFYDILLYKSIQPYPLRDDMERVRNYGKDNNEIPDAKGNLL